MLLGVIVLNEICVRKRISVAFFHSLQEKPEDSNQHVRFNKPENKIRWSKLKAEL